MYVGPGPCITNVIATCRKNFSQWESSFLWKLRYHWLKFLRRVAKTLVIQGPVLQCLRDNHPQNKRCSSIKGHCRALQCTQSPCVLQAMGHICPLNEGRHNATIHVQLSQLYHIATSQNYYHSVLWNVFFCKDMREFLWRVCISWNLWKLVIKLTSGSTFSNKTRLWGMTSASFWSPKQYIYRLLCVSQTRFSHPQLLMITGITQVALFTNFFHPSFEGQSPLEQGGPLDEGTLQCAHRSAFHLNLIKETTYDTWYVINHQGPVSISDKTSYRKISQSLEAARFVFRIIW